jgi:hypothetical protein
MMNSLQLNYFQLKELKKINKLSQDFAKRNQKDLQLINTDISNELTLQELLIENPLRRVTPNRIKKKPIRYPNK